MLKNRHVFAIKKFNQLKAADEWNADQQSYEPVIHAARASEPECDSSKISVQPVNIRILVLTLVTKEEWTNACLALKDCRDFKTSVCLWLLQA